jgi:thiol-disulfide isomerase/thioredoxin
MLGIGVLFILGALFSASQAPSEKSSGLKRYAKGDLVNLELNAGNVLPKGEFEGPDGQFTSLQAFKGQTLVVNLWFEACAPCEEEMPSLARLSEIVSPEGIAVVAVALDREYNKENSRRALQQWTGGALEFYFDKSYGLAYDVGARGMPTTLIYDKSGIEVARLAGGADWASDRAVALVRAIDQRP